MQRRDMEGSEETNGTSSDDASQLSRNRSFKSKQLVRSQAIRESQSPPRTLSPAVDKIDVEYYDESADDSKSDEAKVTNKAFDVNKGTLEVNKGNYEDNKGTCDVNKGDLEAKVDVAIVRTLSDNVTSDASSHVSDDRCSVNSLSERNDCSGDDKKKQAVEIQITSGWEDTQNTQRQRTKRWLGTKQHSSRDLLSNNPRVTCVCGACSPCPQCRGRRRKQACPTKQDSGIVCSDDCPDCSDTDLSGGSNSDGARKTADRTSLDVDDHTFYYCRCPERKEKPKSLSLSRTDSEEKSEPTGVDLVNFIKQTLNKNPRDRVTLLKIEKELHALINDTGRCIVKFPVMTSYGRMLVHRCAALFQLSHHLDQANKTSVLVSKSGTSGGRIPCTSFKQWCTAAFPPSPQRQHSDQTHAKSILKRANQSGEELDAGAGLSSRSKSLEQREREYERVRRRIFSEDNCPPDESQWPWLNSGPVKLLTPDAGRNKLLKVQSLETSTGANPSGGSNRGAVSKSHSFGGYGTQPQPRVLSRHGDLASSSWRLSPSSSGYRTLSLHSADSVTPEPTGVVSPEPSGDVVWCVTDLSAVPSGALLIHPQSGRPLTNPDGSVYHYDPSRPPPLPQYQQQKADQNSEKQRGRLEKQHSFIDNECETTVDQGKCCCECRHHERVDNKVSIQTEEKISHKPASPCKSRYEHAAEATNHSAAPELSANHRVPFEPPANQQPELAGQPYEHYSPNPRAPPYEPVNQRTATYEQTNQRTGSYEQTNQRTASYEPTNQRTASYEPTNQRTDSYESANQRPAHYEPTNQRSVPYEAANQRTAPYETTNQRSVPYEPANHRAEFEMQRQQSFEAKPYEYRPQEGHRPHSHEQYMGHYPPYRHDDVTSPQAGHPTDASLQLHKMMPAPLPEPTMRPLSLTNMMYPVPAPVPQPYPYINQYRMDHPLHPAMYQPIVPPPLEEKQVAPSPHNDSTFRIDPSYPYAPLEYAAPAACGACDPAHRGVSVQYAPVEPPPPPLPPYPIHNVILPPHIQPYPYQDQLHWAGLQPMGHMAPHQNKLLLYPCQYPIVCPQMMPQPYPVLAGPVPAVDRRPSSLHAHRHSKRNSLSGSSRNTPLQTPPDDKKVPYDDMSQNRDNNATIRDNPTIRDNQTIRDSQNVTTSKPETFQRQNSNEIAVKIQQIKDQMAQLNTREKDRDRGQRGREDWKRNSGNGILGSYPANSFNGKVAGRPPPNDESQLSSAARAIVNSIRSMQAKNTYYQDRRPDYGHQNSQYREKPDHQALNQPQNQNQGNQNQVQYQNQNQRVRRERREDRPPAPSRVPQIVQMSPGVWCRRSPGPAHPVLNPPRRPHPDSRNPRR